jgi:hypothetical protein
MINNGYMACEPIRAWNRLEPRCRKHEFDDVLKCGVYDPLWMLTRQWQFGEFHGEDTGSAIFAKIKIESTPITRYKAVNATIETYSDAKPLETHVESEPLAEDFASAIEAGMFFISLLNNYFTTWSTPFSDYHFKDYLAKLQLLFQLDKLNQVQDTDSPEEIIRKLKLGVNNALNIFQVSFENKGIDGKKLYTRAKNSVANLLPDLLISNTHTQVLVKALEEYIGWYEDKYKTQNASPDAKAWKNDQMEYLFGISFPEKTKGNSVLVANEYYTGHLDWYSFDLQSELQPVAGLSGVSDAVEKSQITNKTITVIPTIAKYAGMPNARFWQFEDGSVDLGNIDANTTDISKIIVSEYGLVYANDWMVVPYQVHVGSLTSVQGILITDVFGQCSFLQSAVQGQTDDWSSWGYFNLSLRHPENIRNQPVDTRLLILPSTIKTIESEPLEEVFFVRDEMTNMVWAIESKLNNLCGGNMDGYSQASYLRNAIESIEPADSIHPVDESAMFTYTIQNTVPENWIPFVPVQISGQQRAIQLQRGTMPRWFKGGYFPVRPATGFLRAGINENDTVIQPLIINEEEVPRTGIKLIKSQQLTRWYNGKTFTWVGRQKKIGRGEGSSGLMFDSLKPVKQ